MTLRRESGEGRAHRLLAALAWSHDDTDHLATIRELLSLRADRPRLGGESEQQYFQRIAHELERRTRSGRRARLVRVLRRDARVGA